MKYAGYISPADNLLACEGSAVSVDYRLTGKYVVQNHMHPIWITLVIHPVVFSIVNLPNFTKLYMFCGVTDGDKHFRVGNDW